MNRNTTNTLKLWEILLGVGLALFFVSGMVSMTSQAALAEDVVRLHVLANSDSAQDQAQKLLVRDGVLAQATALLQGVDDQAHAQAILTANLPQLEAAALEILAQQNCSHTVTAEVATTHFPTKTYDGFALPAGEYLSLRILIGEAKGQNWWCVVFPPLCTTAATEVATTAMAAGLENEEIDLITQDDGYVLKFKTIELWGRIQGYLANCTETSP